MKANTFGRGFEDRDGRLSPLEYLSREGVNVRGFNLLEIRRLHGAWVGSDA